MSLYKKNTPKQAVYMRGKKLSKPKKQNIKNTFISGENKEKIKDRVIKDIWKVFEIEEETEERNESEKQNTMKE